MIHKIKKYKKYIKFEYYRVVYRENGQKEDSPDKIFPFQSWIDKIDQVSLPERIGSYYGESIRVERLLFDKNSQYWFVQFSRMRGVNIPSMTRINEVSTPVTLDDDQYFGEEATALYDERTSALMLQRNRNSLSPSGIEEYLNYMWDKIEPQNNITIYLRAFRWENSVERAKKSSVYRKLEIRFADLQKEFKGNSSMTRALKNLKGYQGMTGQITISLGNSNHHTLDHNEVRNTISDMLLTENETLVSSAKLTKKDCDDTKVEIIDLFEDKIHDFKSFEIYGKRTLTLEKDFINPMIELYKNRRQEIISKIMLKGG